MTIQIFTSRFKNEENPESFNAIVTAMIQSILSGKLSAHIDYIHPDLVMLGDVDYDPEIAWESTMVSVDDLRIWLKKRGLKNGFFFPDAPAGPDYLNPEHPNYSPKLAAAVRAWEAVTSESRYKDNGKTPKQNIINWLHKNADNYNLRNDDGSPNKNAIEHQIAKVANWKDAGGAPKTPGGK